MKKGGIIGNMSYHRNSQQTASCRSSFSLDWNRTVLASKSKMHWEHVYSRILHFQFLWFVLYSVFFIRKSSTLGNKIRDQFTVRSQYNKMLQQMQMLQMNEWFCDYWKTQPFFLQIKIRHVKGNDYVMIQVFILHENMFAK